jgi:hypothetical protein
MFPKAVHFALTDDDVADLRSQPGDDAVLAWVDALEDRLWDVSTDRVGETDTAWGTIHRILADGTLGSPPSHYPLTHVVVGGEQMYGGPDHIISLKTPAQVREALGPLRELRRDELRRRYYAIDADDYYETLDEWGWDLAWMWLENLRVFWERASAGGYHVLFTVER